MANTRIYEIINAKIKERLQVALVTGEKFHWVKSWQGIPTGNAIAWQSKNFIPYRGINALLLDGLYITFKQLCEFQGKHPETNFTIKKGTKKDTVYFYKFNEKFEEVEEDGEKKMVKKTIPLIRFYDVFSINNIENLPDYFKIELKEHEYTDAMLKADEVIRSYCERDNVTYNEVEGSDRCFYRPSEHSVTVPLKGQFTSAYEAYASIFHELAHSTMKTLNRDSAGFFGDEKYSKEELIAEITSSMIMAVLGIEDDRTFDNSVAYLQGWLSKLDSADLNFITSAANAAQKACDLILGITHEVETA